MNLYWPMRRPMRVFVFNFGGPRGEADVACAWRVRRVGWPRMGRREDLFGVRTCARCTSFVARREWRDVEVEGGKT